MAGLRKVAILFLVLVIVVPLAFCKTASEKLQEGLFAEEVEGDLDAAIEAYGQVINDESASRALVAQAMYRQGMCYYKRKQENKTIALFEKIKSDYADQQNIIEKVEPILSELMVLDPASLMPPDTFAYIELGSPGKQIETIVNMLKGTPFENPLAAVGGGSNRRGGQNPQAILSALFNPSMMAEFKKVRSVALGVNSGNLNNPPVVVVLDLGSSDALRGMLLAGIGMAAQPNDPIEGMNVFNIGNEVAVAHDDKIILFARPIDRLNWCIKQYKGLIDEPSLASQSNSFSKVSRQLRSDNVFTCWINVDEAYGKVINTFKPDEIDESFYVADAIVDFKNIDEIISHLSIREKGFEFESNIAFKDGHNCLPYNLMRTPNLKSEGFSAVPSKAVGLFSFSLSDPGSAVGIHQGISHVTGLDIGREIFANIEQVSIFVVPPDEGANLAKQSNPIAPFLGVSITSKNPEMTSHILGQLFSLAQMGTTGRIANAEINPALNQYTINIEDEFRFNCFTGRTGKTNIIAFDKDVFKSCISAINNHESVLAGGVLERPLNEMTPNVSKMGMVNVGGAIRVGKSVSEIIFDNPGNSGYALLDEFSRLFDETHFMFYTDESDNNLKVHVSLDNLPEMDKVFPLAMQLSEVDFSRKAKATNPKPGNNGTIGPRKKVKLDWLEGSGAVSHKVYFGKAKENLKFLAEVKDSDEITLPALEEGQKYFWRVDEVLAGGQVVTGNVWNFRIGELVGWWKFDDGSGSIAKDSSSSGKDGTLKGDPQWWTAPDDISGDGAIYLNGEGDAIEVEDFYFKGNTITISAWINGHRAEDWAGIVYSRADGEYAQLASGIHFGGDNRLRYTWNNNSSGTWNWSGGPEVPDDEWVFVACTIEPHKATLYVYSKEKGLKVATHHTRHRNQIINNLKFGWDVGDNEDDMRYYNGLMDDVRIYDYALSKGEIVELYQSKKK